MLLTGDVGQDGRQEAVGADEHLRLALELYLPVLVEIRVVLFAWEIFLASGLGQVGLPKGGIASEVGDLAQDELLDFGGGHGSCRTMLPTPFLGMHTDVVIEPAGPAYCWGGYEKLGKHDTTSHAL